MKPQLILVFFIATNAFTAYAQIKNTDTSSTQSSVKHNMEKALGTGIFKALQHKSETEWIALYPTDDEVRVITENSLPRKAEPLTQRKIDPMLVRRKSEAAATYDSLFRSYLMQGDSLGINWKEASFMKSDCTVTSPENSSLNYLTGDIYFFCGHNQYIIEGLQAVEVKSVYKLQSIQGFRQVMHGE